MLMTVSAVMILVFATDDPAALVAWLMLVASKALAIARAVTWHSRWPRVGWIFAITNAPLRAIRPAVGAVIWIVDVPRWSGGHRVVRRSNLFEQVFDGRHRG